MKAVVDKAGRVQLPKDVRMHLGVDAGGEVVLEQRGGEWVLKPAHLATGLTWEGNVLVHKGASPAGAEATLDQQRDERIGEQFQGLPP
jgi:AbrB family looped-hinge helix DNA binding protein